MATILAACARDVAPPEAPPSDAVAGLRASAAVSLEMSDVAAEALDGRALSILLDDSGFESAVGRSYAGGLGEIRRVEVRVVRFATADGAERYRSWLAEHARDVIGDADPAAALAIPSTSVFLHLPDPCCPRETALALAVWRDGRHVVRVLVAGPGADGSRTRDLVTSLAAWRDPP